MMSVDRLELWDRHFGNQGYTRTAEDIWQIVTRLDDLEDGLAWVLKYVAGCPNDTIESDLRVARDCVHDAFEDLRSTVRMMRSVVAEQNA